MGLRAQININAADDVDSHSNSRCNGDPNSRVANRNARHTSANYRHANLVAGYHAKRGRPGNTDAPGILV